MQSQDFERENDFYQSYSAQKLHPHAHPTFKNIMTYLFCGIATIITLIFIVSLILPDGAMLPALASSTLAAIVLIVLTLFLAFGLVVLVFYSTGKKQDER